MRVPRFGDALTADEVWMLAGSTGHGKDISAFWQQNVPQKGIGNPTAIENARPITEIWRNNVQTHPPLHAVTLRLWREVFGGSDEWARAYSSAWSLLTLGMIFAALRLPFNAGVATCAAILFALSPVQAQLGTEIRSYSMVIAFVSIAAWLIVRMEMLGVTRWEVWSLGLLALPMMLSHYFSIGPCLAIALWGIWGLRGPMRLQLLIALFIAASLFLWMCLPFAVKDLSESGNQFLIAHNPKNRILALTGLLERALISNDGVRKLRLGSIALLGLIGFGCWKDRRVRVWGLFLIIPFAFIFVVDLLQGTEVVRWSRYYSFASVGVVAAPIAAAFAVHKRLGWLVAWCLILVMLSFARLERDLGSIRHDHMIRGFAPIVLKNPVKLPLASISSSATSGSLVSGWDPSIINWARLPGFLPRLTVAIGQSPSPEVIEKLRLSSSNGQFWLTTYGLNSKNKLNQPPAYIRQLIPGIHVVQGPWLIQRGSGYRSERPAMSLWLMKFDDLPPS